MLNNDFRWVAAWKKHQMEFQRARKWCELFREVVRLERNGLPKDLEESIINAFLAKVAIDDYKGAMDVFSTFQGKVIEWRDKRRMM